MRTPSLLPLLALVAGVGCGDVQPVGVDEPLRISGGTFRRGDLPGFEPGTVGAPGPTVNAVTTANPIVAPSRGNAITGRVSSEGNAIGVALLEEGSGWWVHTLQGPDLDFPEDPTFHLEADFGEVSPGFHTLRFVALDADGEAGLQVDRSVCFPLPLPDYGNTCDPTQLPPATVVALRFGNTADVDLILVGPNDETIDIDQPVAAGGIPYLDLDSNFECNPDGRRRENGVFDEDPSGTSWKVYVNLFNSCGQTAVTFAIDVYRRVDNGDGTYGLEVDETFEGQLLGPQANGGAGTGLYVTTLDFP